MIGTLTTGTVTLFFAAALMYSQTATEPCNLMVQAVGGTFRFDCPEESDCLSFGLGPFCLGYTWQIGQTLWIQCVCTEGTPDEGSLPIHDCEAMGAVEAGGGGGISWFCINNNCAQPCTRIKPADVPANLVQICSC